MFWSLSESDVSSEKNFYFLFWFLAYCGGRNRFAQVAKLVDAMPYSRFIACCPSLLICMTLIRLVIRCPHDYTEILDLLITCVLGWYATVGELFVSVEVMERWFPEKARFRCVFLFIPVILKAYRYFLLFLYRSTLCPNKSDPLADFLIACSKVYRIKHNFMNTYQYVLQTIVQSFWKICLSVTQKSNCKQNRINVWLSNYSITTCSQSYNDNV